MTKKIMGSASALALMAIIAGYSAQASNSEGDARSRSHSSEATVRVGQSAPDFTLMSAAGEKHSLSDYEGRFVVLEWINFDCPFVKKHYRSGNIPSLQQKYRDSSVVWLSICSSAPGKQGHLSGKDLSLRIESEKWNGSAYLLDSEGTVGQMYNAKTTPHMYVINPKGHLIYMGAIDDKPTTDLDDVEAAQNYVVLALQAAMTGQSVATPATKSYGCSVKY